MLVTASGTSRPPSAAALTNNETKTKLLAASPTVRTGQHDKCWDACSSRFSSAMAAAQTTVGTIRASLAEQGTFVKKENTFMHDLTQLIHTRVCVRLRTCASVSMYGVVTGCAKSEHGKRHGRVESSRTSPPVGHCGPSED
jgi:hypothetical protein